MINTAIMPTGTVRAINAKVEQYNGSTLANTYNHNDDLVSIKIDRTSESGKFFGFGVCHKANIKLLDINRNKTITTDNTFKIYFNGVNPFPVLYTTDTHRDEKTNQLSITLYDKLYFANNHLVSELGLRAGCYFEYAEACIEILGLNGVSLIGFDEAETASDNTIFHSVNIDSLNVDGTETIKYLLNAIAEATQTIYYIDFNNNLVFKRLDINQIPLVSISKNLYFELKTKDNRKLTKIVSATELGDNVSAETGLIGTTQYIRDNPFWDLRDDIDVLVNNALAAIGNFTIGQFDCKWRGNYLLEIGDCIELIQKDDTPSYSYLLNDTLDYNGGLTQHSKFEYKEENNSKTDNPTSLGEVLKQTYAKVDKANKQIDLVVSQQNTNTADIAALKMDKDSISLSVSALETTLSDTFAAMGSEINTLKQNTELQLTPDDVKILIQEETSNGVNEITTTTGFTFNAEGLTIENADNQKVKTKINEDGMIVSRDNKAVLTADNTGVYAENLHATTYLIIGKNSRFEDYGNRTGCFWIGG